MSPTDFAQPSDVTWLWHPKAVVPPLGPLPENLRIVAAFHQNSPRYLVALAIYVEIQRFQNSHFPFGNDVCQRLLISARKKRQGLKELEQAGLIRVFRRRGVCPDVLVENCQWFDQLPQFLGNLVVEQCSPQDPEEAGRPPEPLCNAADDGTCPIEYPLPTFRAVTVDEALNGFTEHLRIQLKRLIPAHTRDRVEDWEPLAVVVSEMCGNRSIYNLMPEQLVEAQQRVSGVPRYLITNVTLSFVGWLYNNGFLTDHCYQRMKQLLPRYDDRRRREMLAKAPPLDSEKWGARNKQASGPSQQEIREAAGWTL